MLVIGSVAHSYFFGESFELKKNYFFLIEHMFAKITLFAIYIG